MSVSECIRGFVRSLQLTVVGVVFFNTRLAQRIEGAEIVKGIQLVKPVECVVIVQPAAPKEIELKVFDNTEVGSVSF